MERQPEPRGPIMTSAGTHSAGEEAKVFRSSSYGMLLIKQFQGGTKAPKLNVMTTLALDSG